MYGLKTSAILKMKNKSLYILQKSIEQCSQIFNSAEWVEIRDENCFYQRTFFQVNTWKIGLCEMVKK